MNPRTIALSSLISIVAFGASGVPATTTAVTQKPAISVYVNGRKITFPDQQPEVVKGTTLVPLRGVFEAIGAYVEFDPAARTVTAKAQNEVVELRLGSRLARRNGAEILLNQEPLVVKGRTMVPLRFIAESLGAQVEFEKATNSIRIYTTGETPPPNTGGSEPATTTGSQGGTTGGGV